MSWEGIGAVQDSPRSSKDCSAASSSCGGRNSRTGKSGIGSGDEKLSYSGGFLSQRLMTKLCTRLISCDTHQFLPFRSVGFCVGSVQQVNRDMRGFVTQHLKQEPSRHRLEFGIQPYLPSHWAYPPKRLRHPPGKRDCHPARKLGRAPRSGPIGQRLGIVERLVRHGLFWRQNFCLYCH